VKNGFDRSVTVRSNSFSPLFATQAVPPGGLCRRKAVFSFQYLVGNDQEGKSLPSIEADDIGEDPGIGASENRETQPTEPHRWESRIDRVIGRQKRAAGTLRSGGKPKIG
jgi:hypothetical protein